MKTTKPLITLLFLAGIFFSCQQKQFFLDAPEIDLVKKLNESLLKRDFATYRSFFQDTAAIYVNSWFHLKQTPDQFVDGLKKHLENVAELKLAPDSYYDMVVNEKGEHWVHLYTEAIYSLKDGKEVGAMDHAIYRVENNKIVFLGVVIDPMPRYMAEKAIRKGSLIGIHNGTVTLNPGVTIEQFNEFLLNKYIPASEKAHPGTKEFLMKGIRGDKEGTYGIMTIFSSELDRNKYYNNDGSATEAGKAAQQEMKDVLDEFSKMATFKDLYTDWVIQ